MMRRLLLVFLFYPMLMHAQDAERFARMANKGTSFAMDRWMAREFHAQRKGKPVATSSGSYIIHSATYDSLTVWLKRQPAVLDAGWDRCAIKLMIWPGHSTFGVVLRTRNGPLEHCYDLQEGRPGGIRLFGWRAPIRKNREILKLTGRRDCPGFVSEQDRICKELIHSNQ